MNTNNNINTNNTQHRHRYQQQHALSPEDIQTNWQTNERTKQNKQSNTLAEGEGAAAADPPAEKRGSTVDAPRAGTRPTWSHPQPPSPGSNPQVRTTTSYYFSSKNKIVVCSISYTRALKGHPRFFGGETYSEIVWSEVLQWCKGLEIVREKKSIFGFEFCKETYQVWNCSNATEHWPPLQWHPRRYCGGNALGVSVGRVLRYGIPYGTVHVHVPYCTRTSLLADLKVNSWRCRGCLLGTQPFSCDQRSL